MNDQDLQASNGSNFLGVIRKSEVLNIQFPSKAIPLSLLKLMNLYHMCNLLENINIGKLLVQRSDLFFHDPDLLRTSFLFKSCHGSDPLMNQINKRFSLIHQSENKNFIYKRYTKFSFTTEKVRQVASRDSLLHYPFLHLIS